MCTMLRVSAWKCYGLALALAMTVIHLRISLDELRLYRGCPSGRLREAFIRDEIKFLLKTWKEGYTAIQDAVQNYRQTHAYVEHTCTSFKPLINIGPAKLLGSTFRHCL